MRVIVLGAGLLGIVSAYYLRKHGLDVHVVEKEMAPAQGASFGNGGYCQSSIPDPWNAPGSAGVLFKSLWRSATRRGDNSPVSMSLTSIGSFAGWGKKFVDNSDPETYLKHTVINWKLAQYSKQSLRQLENTEALNYSFKKTGALMIARDRTTFERYKVIAEQISTLGVAIRILDRVELIDIEPALAMVSDDLVGGIHLPNDCVGDSQLFCEQIAAVCKSIGVEFSYGQAATQIIKRKSNFIVEYDIGTIESDLVVVTAGTASVDLLRSLGIRLPIVPAKGYTLTLPLDVLDNPPTHIIGDLSTHIGAVPLGNSFRLAGVAEFVGIKRGVSDKRTRYLVKHFGRLFPQYADVDIRKYSDLWYGFRPLSADGLPFIGQTRVAGIYVNTGHGGLGWTQAAGSSRALADLIAGQQPSIGLGDFSACRFSD